MNIPAKTQSADLGASAQSAARRVSEQVKFYRLALGAGVVAAIFARGEIFFNPLYSVDGYRTAFYKYTVYIDLLLMQGRYGELIVYYIRDAIGYYGFDVAVSSLIFASLLFIITGLIFARLIYRLPTAVEASIFVLMFTLHPFNAELFTFSDEILNLIIAFFLSALALHLMMSPRWNAILPSIPLLIFALAIYQTAIACVVTICLFAAIMGIHGNTSDFDRRNFFKSVPVRALVIVMLSVILYLASVKIVVWMTGIATDNHVDIWSIVHVRTKLNFLIAVLKETLLPEKELVRPEISALLLIDLIVSAILVILPVLSARRYGAAVAIAGLLLIALVWSAGATIASGNYGMAPRKFMGFATFAAALLMLGWREARDWLRVALATSLLVLGLSYVGASNRVFYDQRRVNLWDQQEMNRIIGRFETNQNFFAIRAFTVIGGDYMRNRKEVPTQIGDGDMNVSAVAEPFAKLGLILEATGHRFQEATEEEEKKAAAYCQTVESWPALGSTKVLDDLGVVCLPQK